MSWNNWPKIKLTSCPRDAGQGLNPILLKDRIDYVSLLIKSKLFDTIDIGSFVNPKAVPQMKHTWELLKSEEILTLLKGNKIKPLIITGNVKGAREAVKYKAVKYIWFPFSISEFFLEKNINSTIQKSLETLIEIKEICNNTDKELLVYISMAFGNHYNNEKWSLNLLKKYIDILVKEWIKIIALSDTIGISTPNDIHDIFSYSKEKYPNIEFKFHLHTEADKWKERISAALSEWCTSFDVVFTGIGGCPFSGYEKIGNLDAKSLFFYLNEQKKIPLTKEQIRLILKIENEAKSFYALWKKKQDFYKVYEDEEE